MVANQQRKAFMASVAVGSFMATTPAMALTQDQADTLVTSILAAAAIAIAAGYSVFAVVKAAKVGISLLGSFLSKGARG